MKKVTRQFFAVLMVLVFAFGTMPTVFARNYLHDGYDVNAYDIDAHDATFAPLSGILVNFNANGGTILAGNESRFTATGGDTIGAGNMPVNPIRPGFTFIHWNTRADGDGTAFTATTPVTDSITVYAQWGFEVSFHGNGANLLEGNDPNNPAHFLSRFVPTGRDVNTTYGISWVNDPTRPAFVFVGWYDIDAAIGGTRFTADTAITRNTPLFARWTPAPNLTVTFDLQGGTLGGGHTATRQAVAGISISNSSIAPHNLNQGITWPQSAPFVSRPNMTLANWRTQPNGAGTFFAPAGGATAGDSATVAVTQNITVYANWVYRVQFRTTATGLPTNRDFPITSTNGTVNSHAAGMPPDPTRIGATFLGWFLATSYTAAQTGGTPFTGNEIITANTNVWARWDTPPVEGVEVTFSANGGTFPFGGGNTQVRVVGRGFTVSQTVGVSMPYFPNRPGYVFMGWFPTGEYPQLNVHTNRFTLQTTVNDTMTVYARWSPYAVVTFRTQSGINIYLAHRNVPIGFTFRHMANVWGAIEHGSPDPSRYAIFSNLLFPRPGYNLQVWSTVPNPTSMRNYHEQLQPDTVVTGDMTAHFVGTVDITFNNNVPGNTSTLHRRPTLGESFVSSHAHPLNYVGFPVPGPGHFDGHQEWIVFERVDLTWPTIDPVTPHRLDWYRGPEAYWGTDREGRWVHPDFRPNSPNPPEYYVFYWPLLDYYIPIYRHWPQLNRQNFAFRGFNTMANGTGQWATSSTVFTQPTTLFAIWSPNIVFHSGVAPADVILPENAYRNSPSGTPLGAAWPPNPVWPGQTFNSWNTHRNGTGMTYDSTVPINFGRTLFAVWNSTVVFDPNGGNMIGNDIAVVISGSPLGGAIPPAPTRYGYSFVGWNSARNGDGTTYSATAPSVTAGITLYAQWIPIIGTPPVDEDFFYIINFRRESISFGNEFYFAQLDADRNIRECVNGNAIMLPATRSEITVIFNRRADRIRVDRGCWGMTMTGEVCLRRNLRRGGYIGVRRRLPNNTHELIAIIEIPARPSHREIRVHRRDIFLPSQLDAYGQYQPGQMIRNLTDELIEVQFGLDNNFSIHTNLPIRTLLLTPNAVFPMRHDSLPRGARGAYRVAPVEQNNFVTVDGGRRCVRELLLRGVTEVDGVPLELGEGNFPSRPVRFRIPNQPNAPATASMVVAPGRGANPRFITRTTAHMRVLLGEYNDNLVWGQLSANMTIPALAELFNDGGWTKTRRGDYYEFELRIFRNGRTVSAPGFLRIDVSEFVVSPPVSPYTVVDYDSVDYAYTVADDDYDAANYATASDNAYDTPDYAYTASDYYYDVADYDYTVNDDYTVVDDYAVYSDYSTQGDYYTLDDNDYTNDYVVTD